MAELTMKTNHESRIQVGDTVFVVESVYGNEPLEELLAAYICEKIKEDGNSDKAAA